MSFPSPTEADLRAAFGDHGVPFRVHPKQRSRAPWPDGLRAATLHHTAGRDSSDYLASAWSLPGANVCVSNGRYNSTDGVAVVLAWGSCFHSGKGGPWPGVAVADALHLVSWGVEIESLGTVADITDAQVETVGRMLAALIDLGMPAGNVHRHADWTDGTPPVGGFPLPTRGRKIDTNAALGYDTAFWQAAWPPYVTPEEDPMALTDDDIERIAKRVTELVWARPFRDFHDRQERTASWYLVNGGSVEAQVGSDKSVP